MDNTKSIDVLIVIDEEGIIRPLCGTWIDDEHGKYSAEAYLDSKWGRGCSVSKATLTLKS